MGCDQSLYEQTCKPEFGHIKEKLDHMSNRLFIDNGSESFQSRLNRHDRWIKGVMAIVSAIALAILSVGVYLVQERLHTQREILSALQTLAQQRGRETPESP